MIGKNTVFKTDLLPQSFAQQLWLIETNMTSIFIGRYRQSVNFWCISESPSSTLSWLPNLHIRITINKEQSAIYNLVTTIDWIERRSVLESQSALILLHTFSTNHESFNCSTCKHIDNVKTEFIIMDDRLSCFFRNYYRFSESSGFSMIPLTPICFYKT